MGTKSWPSAPSPCIQMTLALGSGRVSISTVSSTSVMTGWLSRARLAGPPSVVHLRMTEFHEEPVRLARMYPDDVRAPVVQLDALRLQPRGRGGNVLHVEAHQVHALAVPGQELPHGRAGVGGLHQLDMAPAQGEDGVLEAKLLGLVPVVHLEAEEASEPLEGLVEIA